MRKNVFIAQGQKRIGTLDSSFLLLIAALALAGCSVTSRNSSSPLAPRPPQFDLSAMPRDPITTVHLQETTLPGLRETATRPDRTALALSANASSKDCSIKSRFDKEALMAYEWGENGRQRLGIDVDGIGLDQFDIEEVKIEYKLRLQPEPTKKQRCRYASSWQGMLGSGYNEMFVREGGDTIWNELGDLEEDVGENLDDLF